MSSLALVRYSLIQFSVSRSDSRFPRRISNLPLCFQADYVILSEQQLRERQKELTETTQALLNMDAGSAAHLLRFCNW